MAADFDLSRHGLALCAQLFRSSRQHFPTAGLAWLTAGGVAYTVGILFYVLDNRSKASAMLMGSGICSFYLDPYAISFR